VIDPVEVERLASEDPNIKKVAAQLGLDDDSWSAAIDDDRIKDAYVSGYRAFVAEMHRKLDAGEFVPVGRFADLTTKDRRLLLEKAAEVKRNRAADRELEKERRHAVKPGYGRIRGSRR
jgi:hypothetical protein